MGRPELISAIGRHGPKSPRGSPDHPASALNITKTESSVAFVAADDNTVKYISYVGNLQFITLDLVSTGTSSGGTLGVNVILEGLDVAPPA